MPWFREVDSYQNIAHGNMDGMSPTHKFGKNDDVGTTYEPLSIGGIYRTPQVAGAVTVRVKAGGNANDTAAGSGAREVTVQGLDETGALVSEAITTAGASASSATTTTFIRIFRAYVSSSGTYATASAGSHAAAIVIEDSGGVEDWLTIWFTDFPRSQSQIGAYSVPLGKTAFVHEYVLTTDANKAVDFVFFKRESILDTAAPYQAMRTVVEEIGIQGEFAGTFPGGQKFTELTDIGWMVKAASAAIVTADFEIQLVDNALVT